MWDESIGPEDEYPQQPAGLVTTGFPQHRTTSHNIPFQCLECLYIEPFHGRVPVQIAISAKTMRCDFEAYRILRQKTILSVDIGCIVPIPSSLYYHKWIYMVC